MPAAAIAVPTMSDWRCRRLRDRLLMNDTVTPRPTSGNRLMNASAQKSPIVDTKFFTPEVRLDVN